jgi:hypothetical protein
MIIISNVNKLPHLAKLQRPHLARRQYPQLAKLRDHSKRP